MLMRPDCVVGPNILANNAQDQFVQTEAKAEDVDQALLAMWLHSCGLTQFPIPHKPESLNQ